jgi:hypothetical protein
MDKIRFSLEDIKALVKKYEDVKKNGAEMIHELKELINARPEVIQLLEASDKKLSVRFFDLIFYIQVEINSSKIGSAIGSLRTYMDMPDDKARFIENMEFTFDDGGNIQQKDELYILSPEVFPYYFLSKLTDFIVSQRIVIKP